MTGTELLEKLRVGLDGDVGTLAYEDFDGDELGIGPYKVVQSTGGCDKGSDWSRIFHFIEHNIYVKVTGYYQSHHGTDFGGWDEEVSLVEPQEKIITVYE